MKIRQYKLLFVMILVLFLLTACGAGNANTPGSSATQAPATGVAEPTSAPTATEAPTEIPTEAASACDNPYSPVVVSATWNYKLTGPVPDTYTHSILSVESDSFTEQDVFGVGVTRQGQWKCENGDLIALNPPSGSSGTVETDNVKVDFQTKELSGVTLPGSIKAGDTWSQMLSLEGTETINGMELPASNKVTSTCKAIGIESVTVEAGTFDAMRVECQNSMDVAIKFGDQETATTIDLTGISWYVENIGMVKNATTGSGLDSTTELVSYNIP